MSINIFRLPLLVVRGIRINLHVYFGVLDDLEMKIYDQPKSLLSFIGHMSCFSEVFAASYTSCDVNVLHKSLSLSVVKKKVVML